MPQPIRVVQVSFHSDDERRSARVLLDAWATLPAVAAAAARAGADVTVVQTAHRDERIRQDGVDFHFVADDDRQRRRVIARVASLEPSVVHVHGFHHGHAVRGLTRALRGIPVLIQEHGGAPPAGPRRLAWRWAFRSIAGAAFTTRAHAAPWIDAGVVRGNTPLFEVLEGSSSFTPGDQHRARHDTGLFGDPCLLWTSRLNAGKDPLMMLEAVEQALPQLGDAHLWCCFGDASMLGAVRARVDGSDILRGRVTLMGTRAHREMEPLYRAADFYLQTSRHEGSGYSLLEAMSCGTTPIVTDIPAARRIVGSVGSLTPVGDSHAFAAALMDWTRRERYALRTATRARFERELTFDAIGNQLRAVYDSLAGAAAAAR